MPLLTVKESDATVIEPSRELISEPTRELVFEPLFEPAREPLFEIILEPLFKLARELIEPNFAYLKLSSKSSFKFRLNLNSFTLTSEAKRTFTKPSLNDSAHLRP